MNKLLLLLFSTLALSSCIRKEFDAPDVDISYDPNLPVNMSIGALKLKFSGPSATRIDSNWTIYGIVTADDRSGNLYKQINIEDSTGGITLLLNSTNLYGTYPIGRKVYVKLQGLYYGYYGGYPQIGAQPGSDGDLSQIPAAAIPTYVERASYPNTVTPKSFADLSTLKTTFVFNPLYNRLVEIDNVEFIDADTSKTYSDPATIASGTDRKIQDCFGNQMVVRTSGYANFQSYKLPKGRGKITGIYTVFVSGSRSTPQLLLRDTSDVKFYGVRCAADPAPELPKVSIDSLRRRYTGTAVTLGATQITGVVISNRLRENLDPRNLVLQQGDRGIVVRFSAQHSFNQGDSLVIDASGQSLSEFGAVLQITSSSFPIAKAQRVASGISITPQTLTIAQIIGPAFENYESTLVRILNGTASGGATYTNGTSNTSRTLNDGTGSITLYTDGDATFGATALPTGPRTWVGIVGQFNATKQFSIRDVTDVQ